MLLRGVTLSFVSFMALTAQVSVSPIAHELTPYISVLAYGTAAYHEAAREIMPGSSLAVLSSILPYSVIVQNVSNEPLLGVSVAFRNESSDGKTRPYSFTSRNMDPTTKPVLLPGGYALYTPSPPLYLAISRKHPVESLALPTILADLSRERQITFAVEAVITSRGVLLGPDTLGSFDMIQAEQEAERRLVDMLTQLSGSPSAQMAKLRALSEMQTVPSNDPFHRDFYNIALRNHAKHLLNLMQAGRDVNTSAFMAQTKRNIRIVRQ
jgi:hypothetical protein